MKEKLMKKARFNPVPAHLQAEVDALAALPEDKIDTDEMPEVQDWSNAKRGMFYRPDKKQVTLSLDADLVEWFENHHPEEGYQNSINQALREYIAKGA